MKITTLILLATLLSIVAWARKKHEPRPELCNLKTVYIDGNSESASIARHELEKRTWLKLENEQAKADAVLSITETRTQGHTIWAGQDVTASAELKQGTKLLWSDSAESAERPLVSNARAAVKIVLSHLNGEAACK